MKRQLLAMLIGVFVVSSVDGSARDDEDVEPRCLDALAVFAAEQGVSMDGHRVEFSARWVGAGHEVSRVPGLTARIPVDRCNGVLAVDLSEMCRILKSRGEEGCSATFPMAFH